MFYKPSLSFEGAEDIHNFSAMWLYMDLSNISGMTV